MWATHRGLCSTALSSLNGLARIAAQGRKQQRHISRQSGPSVNVERKSEWWTRERSPLGIRDSRAAPKLCVAMTFLFFFFFFSRLSVENRLKYLNGNGPNDSENSSFLLLSLSFVSRSSHTANGGQTPAIAQRSYVGITRRRAVLSQKIRQSPLQSTVSKTPTSETASSIRLTYISPKVRKRVDWCRQFVYPQKRLSRDPPLRPSGTSTGL